MYPFGLPEADFAHSVVSGVPPRYSVLYPDGIPTPGANNIDFAINRLLMAPDQPLAAGTVDFLYTQLHS